MMDDSTDQRDSEAVDSREDAVSAQDAAQALARKAYDTVSGEASYPDDLAHAAARLLDTGDGLPEVGSLVQWKPGLKQFSYPDYGRPMCYLGPRASNRPNSFFPDVRDELADVYIGFIDGERMFEILAVDARRVTRWISPD